MKHGLLGAGALLFTSVSLLGSPAMAEPVKGGVIDVATVGEPPTLDPMTSTADLVGMITQHIFETLYTFDKDWNVVPLLAEAMPDISQDGKIYAIKLRSGVKFQDGSDMTSKDVVASLKRWEEVASRGKQTASDIQSIEADGDLGVKITLKQPYAPLLSLLAFNNSAAIILPSDDQDMPLKKVIGTGPYMLKDRKPDQYIQLVRFDGYKSRSDAPNGYGGARHQYLDEIRFVPVPDPNTRVQGAIAGQFAYADSLPVESYDQVKGGKDKAMILKPFGWPVFMMNTKEGVLSNLQIRKAVQAAMNSEDMLLAAFGSKEFFTVDGSLYPEGFAWHSDAGTEAYNQGNPEKAAELLKKAGYDGKPIRILTSRQYEFHYKMAQVAQAYLEQAGFKVDMQVVDWATLTQRRADPKLWDMFITHSPFLPEPALNGYMQDSSPGWWATDAKHAAIEPFVTETDPKKRAALFSKVQQVTFDEVPMYKVGDFNALAAVSPELKDVNQASWPYFWNAYLQK